LCRVYGYPVEVQKYRQRFQPRIAGRRGQVNAIFDLI